MTKLTPEPTLHEEATQHLGWKEAMKQEYESIMKSDTWTPVNLSSRKVPITTKWVYKTKITTNDRVEKLKGCLATQRLEQRKGFNNGKNLCTYCEVSDHTYDGCFVSLT
jgi:hypothetical protein